MKVFLFFIMYAILTLLYIPLTIINIIIVVIKSFKNDKNVPTSIFDYIKEEIREIDIFAGNSFRTFFNTVMLKNEYIYKFGSNKRETISSIMGKNEIKNNLSKFGKLTSKVCNIFEKDHYKNSIDSHIERGEIFCNQNNFFCKK